MSNTPLILQPLVKYVDFKGRSRRSEFWPFYIAICAFFWIVEAWLLAPLLPMLSGGLPDMAAMKGRLMPYAIVMVLGLAVVLPLYAVKVRRLHDTNRTGWWCLLPVGASYIGQSLVYMFRGQDILAATQSMQGQMQSMMLDGGFDLTKIIQMELPIMTITLPYTMGASLVAGLVLVYFWVLPGTPGPNRFGINPKAS